MDVRFNLQDALRDMENRAEARHQELVEKVDITRDTVNDHDLRLDRLETSHGMIKWGFRVSVVAVLGAVAEFVMVHLPRMFGKS